MLPIYIFDGSVRYLLVRAGSDLGRATEHAQRVHPAHACAVLHGALQRQPQLAQDLAELIHRRGEDPETIAEQVLAELRRTGMIAGGVVMVRVEMGPASVAQSPEPELPKLPSDEPPEQPPEEEEEEPPEAKTTIRVSLFFDGTANNRQNTLERLNDTETWKKNKKQGSFQNDFTNVSRLETLCTGDPSFDHSFSIYVEGIGTTDGEGDSLYGMGVGMGDTGVPAKVKAGVRELLRGIRELGIASGEIIERIHLDAFGFSRGAAAARHFVHYVLNSKEKLEPRIEGLGYPVELLEVNFIGLFDTVASYGLKHSNDTSDLNLDAVRVAKKCVQLAAAEEHRKNFRLTDISSAVGAGVGVELYLPGVHSDVGGGYNDNADEVDLQILDFNVMRSTKSLKQRFARERQWLIDSGWYDKEEIHEVNWWNELKVTKRGIRNHYNRIPLKHMHDFATQTGLTFDPVAVRHPIPAALASIDALVDAHVAAHVAGTAASTAEHWINMMTPDYQRLRHDYLHFSANYNSIANPPQFTNDDPRNGQRRRVVQRG